VIRWAISSVIARLLRRRVQHPVAPIDLHLMMVGLALYRITNSATVEATFGLSMDSPEFKEHQVRLLIEMLVGWLRTPAGTGLTGGVPIETRHTA
jgi:hypothetical protein